MGKRELKNISKVQLKDEVFVTVSGCDASRDRCVTGHDVNTGL